MPNVPSGSDTQYSAMCVCPIKTSGASVSANALRRGALVEDVFEVVHRRAVHQQEIRSSEFRTARLLSHARLSSLSTLLRPGDRCARGIVEVLDAEIFDRGEIVIAEHRVLQARREAARRTRWGWARSRRCRPGTHLVVGSHQRERALERLDVPVNVGDDRVALTRHARKAARRRGRRPANASRIGGVPALTRT